MICNVMKVGHHLGQRGGAVPFFQSILCVLLFVKELVDTVILSHYTAFQHVLGGYCDDFSARVTCPYTLPMTEDSRVKHLHVNFTCIYTSFMLHELHSIICILCKIVMNFKAVIKSYLNFVLYNLYITRSSPTRKCASQGRLRSLPGVPSATIFPMSCHDTTGTPFYLFLKSNPFFTKLPCNEFISYNIG